MKRHLAWCALVVVVIILTSCAGLDSFFGVDQYGNDLPGPSPAESGGSALAPLLPDGSGGGVPWNELGLGALLLIQNGYILIRRLQAKLGKNGKAPATPA
jgi:hypothetical protein